MHEYGLIKDTDKTKATCKVTCFKLRGKSMYHQVMLFHWSSVLCKAENSSLAHYSTDCALS